METKEYRTMDKSQWGNGPWNIEPDKLQWEDPETKLPCLIVRNHAGALCGYVGVSKEHRFFEKHYDDVDVNVHGGLTYSDHCQNGDEESSICHISNDNDSVWWLGFDCFHFMDFAPGLTDNMSLKHKIYRDIEYVKSEITNLAKQLATIGESNE